MATFKTDVEGYVGTFADTTQLDTWLTAAARHLIQLIPKDKAQTFATSLSIVGAGTDVSTYRVIAGQRGSYGCREVPSNLQADVADANSLHYAIASDPVFFIRDTKMFIYPTGGVATASVIAYPTVANTDSALTTLPLEFRHLVVLWTAKQARLNQINSLIASLPADVAAPSFTFTPVTVSTIATNALFSIDLSTDFTNLNTDVRTDEDIEKAQGQIETIRTKLQEFLQEANLELERVRFNAQATNEVNILNASKELERQIGEYGAKINNYLGQLQKYFGKQKLYLDGLSAINYEYETLLKLYLGGQAPRTPEEKS